MVKTTEKIGSILHTRSDVTEWTVTGNTDQRRELYLIGNKTEQLRAVEGKDYSVTVFCDIEEKGDLKRGSTTFSITESDAQSDSALSQIIDSGVYAARLALNPHYTLDEYRESDVETAGYDEEAAADLTATVEKMAAETIECCNGEDEVYLASSEVFLTKSNTVKRNSNGLFHENITTSCMYELAIDSTVNADVETHLLLNERLIKNIAVSESVKRYAQYCRENTLATLPPSGKVNVIFTDEAFETLFRYFMVQVSASARYARMASLEIGDEIIPGAMGDKLSICFDPYLPGGAIAAKYDHYGTLLMKHTAIEDGVFIKRMADKRFGTYLGCEITGSPTNVIVKEGNTPYRDMIEEDMFVLSRFSTFSPNAISGDFSAEIRNGHVVKDGKLHPIKGGSVSGNLKDCFKNATLSSETIQYGNYYGPEYVKVTDVTSSGT